MRLHRFFIADPLKDLEKFSVTDTELLHQLKHVFRMQAGDRLILLDNSGFEFTAEITLLTKEKAELNILESKENEAKPRREIWLFASLIKKDNYEWVLQKCTELGVSHFVPVISERSEKKSLNTERAEKIMKEASEQSGRGRLPELHETVLLEETLGSFASKLQFVAFDGGGEKLESPSTLFGADPIKIGILIGSEGGWSEKELELFKQKNIPVYSLGNTTLRAETASIVASAFLLLQ